MYENLLRLPYFQGMSKDDMTSILDKVTFEFVKHNDGEIICSKDTPCDNFHILINGEMSIVAYDEDNSYKISEEVAAPYAIEPYSMFGYNTGYKREYISHKNCTTLKIDKKYFFSELCKHNIFTINFLNQISYKAQKLESTVWKQTSSSIAARIYRFILLRCDRPNGRKTISIKMERLAAILCETRLSISKTLNELQDAGLVELHRKEIVVHSLSKLHDYIKQ